MKKLLSLLLSLSLFLVLGACSSNTSESTDENGVVNLTMWVHVTDEGGEGQFYADRAAAFNAAHDNINATIEFIPRGGGGSGYEDKINTALTTGQLPDVITLDGPNTAAYADAGIIAPLDGYISQDSINDFMPSIIAQGSYNGSLYALGNMESTVPLFYNVDLLAKYNIQPGTIDNPWTWDDLYAAAVTITAGENGYPALNLSLDWGGEGKIYALAPFVWSNGGDVIDSTGLVADGVFNSAESYEGFAFIKSLVDAGVTTATPEAQSFELGKAAFMLNGPWAVGGLENDFADLNWGVMPYPVSPDTNTLAVPTGSWEIAMTTNSAHPEEAAMLVDWMTNTDSVVAIANAIGMLPARMSAVDLLPQYQEGARKLMVDQLASGGHARPVSVIYPVISRSFEEAVNEIVYGEDIQSTLDSKVAIIEREAQRYK